MILSLPKKIGHLLENAYLLQKEVIYESRKDEYRD
jgi:hypothetical protein